MIIRYWNSMLDNWLILSLVVTFAIGIVWFTNKIFAERKYNVKFSALILYVFLFIFAIITGLTLWFSSYEEIWRQNFILSVISWIQMYTYTFIMMTALRYIPTSTYFITVRLSSSFILLLIGIFFFGDILTAKELFWFLFGVVAMLLLFEKEERKHSKYIIWLIFLVFWILSLVMGHSISKILSFDLSTIPSVLTIIFFSALLFSLVFWYKEIKPNMYNLKEISKINFLQAIFYFIYIYLLYYVYKSGDLGISYKIQSYSPFIPIILAAIIYKENISNKKMLWIFITAISLYFFA